MLALTLAIDAMDVQFQALPWNPLLLLDAEFASALCSKGCAVPAPHHLPNALGLASFYMEIDGPVSSCLNSQQAGVTQCQPATVSKLVQVLRPFE